MNKSKLLVSQKYKSKIPLGKLFDAFEEVKSIVNQKDNVFQACKEILGKYGFPLTINAFMLKYLRFIKNNGKFDNRNLFTAKTEQIFVGVLEAFSRLSLSISRKMFLDYVSTFKSNKRSLDLDGWFQKFIQRHQDKLLTKTIKGIKMERINNVGYEVIQEFANNYENIIEKKEISTDNIFNVDETRISINMKNYKFTAIESCSKLYHSTIQSNDYTGATYIPFISRKKVFMHVVILPDKKCNGKDISIIKPPRHTRYGAPLLFIAYTNSGYLNGDVWNLIIKKFCDEIRKYVLKSHILLLMDNLRIHNNFNALSMCNKNNIHVLFFPCYSSHYMQPADDLFFLNIKKQMKQKYSRMLANVKKNESLSLEMIDIVVNIHNTISEEIISKSWENTCLIPFNRIKMLERAKLNCGVGDIENNSSVADIARNAASELIKQSRTSISKLSTNKMELNKLYELDDVITKKNDKNSAKTPANKCSKPNGSELVENPKKRKKISNIKCFYQYHSDEKKTIQDIKLDERCCNICKVFRFCSRCFVDAPEALFSHEEDCKKLTKKLKVKNG